MSMDGFFWYSREQKELIEQFYGYNKNFCNIGGKVKEYTQWMSGKYLRDPSNWEDAICLGYGFFSHHEPNTPIHPTKSGGEENH